MLDEQPRGQPTPAFRISLLSYGRSPVSDSRTYLVAPAGLEPATCGLGNRCSILLSYGATHERYGLAAIQSIGFEQRRAAQTLSSTRGFCYGLSMPRLVIYGIGGMGRYLLRQARDIVAQTPVFEELVFASDSSSPPVHGVPVISPDDFRDDDQVAVAVADPLVRRRLSERCPNLATIISPLAVWGEGVEVGPGLILCDFAMFTSDVKIGRGFLCNCYSWVAHECIVGDFVTFSGRVSCNGNVHIGDNVFVGSDATILNGTDDKPIRIGDGAVIGAGAVVTKDVPPGAKVVGVPARPIWSPRLVSVAEPETACAR